MIPRPFPTDYEMSIRQALVGNNQLESSFDYIRLFLIVILKLELRKEVKDESLYDAASNFAERFNYPRC